MLYFLLELYAITQFVVIVYSSHIGGIALVSEICSILRLLIVYFEPLLMRYIFVHLHVDVNLNGILIYALFVMLGVDCQKLEPVLFSKGIEAKVVVSVPPSICYVKYC